jgi:hypothetical protein
LAQGVVHRQPVLGFQLQHHHGGERLRVAADLHQAVGGHRLGATELRRSGG